MMCAFYANLKKQFDQATWYFNTADVKCSAQVLAFVIKSALEIKTIAWLFPLFLSVFGTTDVEVTIPLIVRFSLGILA